VKAVANQERQPAGVIDVRVAQDHRIDPAGVDWELGVFPGRFGSAALKQAGVEQHPSSRRFEQMHRPGHFARGAPER
jgi:hypothetical protein